MEVTMNSYGWRSVLSILIMYHGVSATYFSGVFTVPDSGLTFIAALEYEAEGGWREDAYSACSRFDMKPAGQSAVLSPNNTLPLKWTVELLQQISAGMGYTADSDAVQSCCSSSMWCVRYGTSDTAFRCHANGIGTFEYVNYGWTQNTSRVPVYACTTPSASSLLPDGPGTVMGINVSSAMSTFPVVGPVSVIMNTPYTTPRLQVDGVGFGSEGSQLQVNVGGRHCKDVDICSDVCARCDRASDCGDGKRCTYYKGVGYCLRLCNSDSTCPCGLKCVSVLINPFIGLSENICFNPEAVVDRSRLCDNRARFRPPANSSYNSRIECSLDWLRKQQVQSRRQLSTPSTPLIELGHIPELVPMTTHPVSRARKLVEAAWPVAIPPASYSYRYAAPCAQSGSLDVTVIKDGAASSGLDNRLLEAAGVLAPQAAMNTSYSGSIGNVTLPCGSCSIDSDCPFVDAISRPVCSLAAGTGLGCCVYQGSDGELIRSMDSAAAGEEGKGLASLEYLILPKEVAASLPLPPPPMGNLNGKVANMSDRDPRTNPYAIMWDARNAWYSDGVVGPYQLSAAAFVDDGPSAPFRLGFNVSVYGTVTNTIYISPNGFLRAVPGTPCTGTFERTRCVLANAYVGLAGALVADLDPGHYTTSEVWVSTVNGSQTPQAEANAGSQGVCVVWLNMGLWNEQASSVQPPDPSFTSQVCVFGDGAVRFRYGSVFGVPGYGPGGWTPSTLVPPGGGPPQQSWLGGLRSLDAGEGVPAGSLAAVLGPFQDDDIDIPIANSKNTLLSRQAVRPGGSAAFCPFSPIACASPTCGTAGTVIRIKWDVPKCGLGIGRWVDGGQAVVPIIQCLFGELAVIADVAADMKSISCIAPDPPSWMAGSGAVPLRIQLMVPVTETAYTGATARYSTPTYAELRELGIGTEAAALNFTSQLATVAVDIYGVERYSIRNTTGLVQKALYFSYSAGGVTCGCHDQLECDTCNVCGGVERTVDCAGTCFGNAFVDLCGVCSGGVTGHVANSDVDCNGVCFGSDTTCTPSDNPSGLQPGDAGIALTVIVIIALVTCSIAVFAILAYFGWVAMLRRRDGFFDWHAASVQPAAPRGLLEDTIVGIPIVSYHEKQAVEESGHASERTNDDTCPICLEKYAEGDQLRVLPPCQHRFHVACADQWLQRSHQCPVCRADLRTDVELAYEGGSDHSAQSAPAALANPRESPVGQNLVQYSRRRDVLAHTTRVNVRPRGDIELPSIASNAQPRSMEDIAVSIPRAIEFETGGPAYRNPMRSPGSGLPRTLV